jgi:hypothetical protein
MEGANMSRVVIRPAASSAVTSVNGQTGVVVLTAADVGAVESVNTQTGAVVLDAGDVGAIPTSEKGVANGVASLGANSRVVQDTELVFGYRALSYIAGDFGIQSTSAIYTVGGTLYGHPLVVHNDITLTSICTSVEVAMSATSVVRLGIYRSLSDGTKELVIDAGVINGTITGYQDISINITLTKGIYFLCACSQGHVGQSGQIRVAANVNFQYADRSITQRNSGIGCGIILAQGVTGAFDATISSTLEGITAAVPMVFIRRS